MQSSPRSDGGADLVNLSSRDIFLMLPSFYPVEAIIVRAVLGTTINAATPTLAAADPLKVKTSGQRLDDVFIQRLLR